MPTAPAAIRITPTTSQFTNVPPTWEVGSIANLRIAPAAAKINDIPIRILTHRFLIKEGLGSPAAQDEQTHRDDGQDDKDGDQHMGSPFRTVDFDADPGARSRYCARLSEETRRAVAGPPKALSAS